MAQSSPSSDPTAGWQIARRPVITTNVLAALVLEVCNLLRQFGLPLTEGQQAAISEVATVLLLIGAGLFAQRLTTPLTDPRDNRGRPLTPDLPPATPGNLWPPAVT